MERDGCLVRRAILPTPAEKASPRERQRAHSGLVRLARIALLRVIDTCPEGMPARFRGPRHAGVAEAGRTLEAPGDPALLATPFRDRGKARALWQGGGGRIAVAVCAEGDEEPGSEAGASAGAGLEHGAVGRTLGMLRDGVVKGLHRRHGGPELADEGVHKQPSGGEDTRIGSQGEGSLDGGDALGNNVCRAPMVLAQEGLPGSAAGQVGRLQGWPAAANVTKDDGVLVRKPLEPLRASVLQGAGEPLGAAHCVANHAPAVFDAWGQSTPGGALRLAGRPLVAVRAEHCALQCGVRGGILRATGGKRFAVPGEGQRVDGQEPQDVVWTQGKDAGAVVECEADGERCPLASLLQGTPPRLNGFWCVVATVGLSWLGARRW
jgi:hypothetical protein